MKIISIGDLVTDFYYKNGKLLGVNGGMTSHNIIANLAIFGSETSVIGACGADAAGEIAVKSLKDIGVDVSNINMISGVKTRTFHVSYFDKASSLTFISKKRCPFCQSKNWYENSLIDSKKAIEIIGNEDILVFDNLNSANREIINKSKNKKMLDLGQYFEFDSCTNKEIVSALKDKFIIINLNERVEKYLLDRFKLNNLLDIYNLISPQLLIVTRGKNGADFVYGGKVVHKNLLTISKEIDSTGAGDAFFSAYIYEYSKNQQINDDYIEKTFKLATNLTSKVVKFMGARGHINKLYKIKNINSNCTCQDFTLSIRKTIKRCSINVNNLKKRTIDALNSSACKNINNLNIEKLNNIITIGTGGSYASAVFASKVLNEKYAKNSFPLLPREFYYRNNSNIDMIFLFSYSGTTSDLIESTKKIDNSKKIIITKGEKSKVSTKTGISEENIFSYRSSTNKGKEHGFLSFEGSVAPAVLFLDLYMSNHEECEKFVIDCFDYWNKYFDEYFKKNKKILKNQLHVGNTINIFTGDYVSCSTIDFESKIIESGLFNAINHEKKNFSHGRFINYEHLSQKINIYFKQKDTSIYEQDLLKYIAGDNNIIIESRYNGILCEYDLLIASQYLAYYIANLLDIDISKPTYSDKAMKIYFYKGKI